MRRLGAAIAAAALQISTPSLAQGVHGGVDGFDVTHYGVQLTPDIRNPDIRNKAVAGREAVSFIVG